MSTAARSRQPQKALQTHIRSIYRKLEVSTKAEATLEAVRRGYLR